MLKTLLEPGYQLLRRARLWPKDQMILSKGKGQLQLEHVLLLGNQVTREQVSDRMVLDPHFPLHGRDHRGRGELAGALVGISRVVLGLALDEIGLLGGQTANLHIGNTAALGDGRAATLYEKGLARLIVPDITGGRRGRLHICLR